jgi:hypothetical protein
MQAFSLMLSVLDLNRLLININIHLENNAFVSSSFINVSVGIKHNLLRVIVSAVVIKGKFIIVGTAPNICPACRKPTIDRLPSDSVLVNFTIPVHMRHMV